jgi:hypothetical protein
VSEHGIIFLNYWMLSVISYSLCLLVLDHLPSAELTQLANEAGEVKTSLTGAKKGIGMHLYPDGI